MRIVTNEMRNPNPRRIAILYPASIPWMARCLDGIRQYAREQGGWQIFSSPPTVHGVGESALSLRSMEGWGGDGIIVATNDRSELRRARKLSTPIINLAGGDADSHGVPRVMVNNYEAGRMAADHLIDRGLVNLAFFGWKDLWYSQQRQIGFTERARESEIECHVMLRAASEEAGLTWSQRVAEPAKWLASLPRPCGVFGVHDYRAQLILEASQEAGLRIPEDLAVIGMDNDETICQHSIPRLSSVSRSSARVGHAAAELLDQLICGKPGLRQITSVPPAGVHARESTEAFYCSDPLVGQAIEIMRENLNLEFNIAFIADHLGVSKRKLETRFRESVSSSPHAYLTTLRVKHAQRLIKTDQKQTLAKIASKSGFRNSPTFYSAFRRVTGDSPAAFRRKLVDTQDARAS